MKDLAGRVVLVTGGGTGVGRAIALAFASRKSRVIVIGRTKTKLDSVVDEITRSGGKVFARTCDVTQKSQLERLSQEISDHFGSVQILVNNAAIAPAVGFLEMEDHLWEQV